MSSVTDTEQSTVNPMNKDEEVIKKLTENGDFSTAIETSVDDENLLTFLTDYLMQRYQGKPLIVAFTGAPASGKTTQVEQLIAQLRSNDHSSDVVRTDDFNLYHRIERNQKIAEGANPLQVKDFELLERVVEDVRAGRGTKAPVYDEATGDAIVVGGESPPYDTDKFPHDIPAGLHYLFVDGDFQPLESPDVRIYLHVPTDIRRENRVARDLEKRGGYGDADAIRQSFDSRIQKQYYPYTLPNAEKCDVLITTQAEKVDGHRFAYKYSYKVYTQ